MALRAEIASMEDRISHLESVTRDQEMIIKDVKKLNEMLRDALAKKPLFRIRSSDPASIYAAVPLDDVVRLILEHLGLEAEEVQFQSLVRLVNKAAKE